MHSGHDGCPFGQGSPSWTCLCAGRSRRPQSVYRHVLPGPTNMWQNSSSVPIADAGLGVLGDRRGVAFGRAFGGLAAGSTVAGPRRPPPNTATWPP